ncbi:MAG: formate dehydrogenase [Rubrivivax sp.]|nr:formate dehydrogenase [Rubrivivax sp.]
MSERKETLARRTLLGGAVTATAAAGAVALMPSRPEPQAVPQALAQAGDAAQGEGYRLTEHVRQYYATTRI